MRKTVFILLLTMVMGGCANATYYGHAEQQTKNLIGKNYMMALLQTASAETEYATFSCDNGNATICVPYMHFTRFGGRTKFKSGYKYICYEADESTYIYNIYDAQTSPVGNQVNLNDAESLYCGKYTAESLLDPNTGRLTR